MGWPRRATSCRHRAGHRVRWVWPPGVVESAAGGVGSGQRYGVVWAGVLSSCGGRQWLGDAGAATPPPADGSAGQRSGRALAAVVLPPMRRRQRLRPWWVDDRSGNRSRLCAYRSGSTDVARRSPRSATVRSAGSPEQAPGNYPPDGLRGEGDEPADRHGLQGDPRLAPRHEPAT